MKTLRQLLDEANEAQKSGTSTPQQEQLQAAYWAGIEVGRGKVAREVEARILVARAKAAGLRYWRQALDLIPGNPASVNDDSAEIMSWDWLSDETEAA